MDLLLGYETKWGQKKVAIADVPGPDYYFTGGSEISAPDDGLNWGAFDQVIFGTSQSGTYTAFARFSTDGAAQIVKMVVVVTATGTEVAYGIDLGAETFRGIFIGV